MALANVANKATHQYHYLYGVRSLHLLLIDSHQ